MPIDNSALFELAEKYRAQNNLPLAVQLYNEILGQMPNYAIFGQMGLIFSNMAKLLNGQQNFLGELDSIKKFMACPLTPLTFDLMGPFKVRMAELEKQFPNSQPGQAVVQVK